MEDASRFGKPFVPGYAQPDPPLVFVCSNRGCGQVWNEDPKGPCPKCRRANGSGWSTWASTPRDLPGPDAPPEA